MTREIGFVNVKTISGYRKSNELFNWAKGASVYWVDIFFLEEHFWRFHKLYLLKELSSFSSEAIIIGRPKLPYAF